MAPRGFRLGNLPVSAHFGKFDIPAAGISKGDTKERQSEQRTANSIGKLQVDVQNLPSRLSENVSTAVERLGQ